MSDKMRQELNGVKAAVGALGVQVNALQTAVGVLKTDVGALKTDVGALKKMTHNLAVTVAGHTEHFIRIEKRLEKLDEFDGLKNSLDVLVSEIISSRHERTLRDKSFSDQQATLTDHELRLTRIELRGKQS
jgi:hypothetical protein